MKDVGTIRLETERLILRRLEKNDANNMFNYWCNDKDVTRYLPWNPHGTIDVTNELLDMWINDYNNSYVYRWIVVLKDDNKPIGTIDVVNKDIDNKVFEVGYCYSKNIWGNGYGTEVLSKVISFLFENVGVELIMAKHNENNPASGKVMQKSGMKYDGMLRSMVIDKETRDRVGLVYYSITKDEYFEGTSK